MGVELGDMTNPNLAFILMIISFAVSTFVYPSVLGFAIRHHIVDNPNARKLQRVPVPVMGGTVVFLGLLVATVVGYFCLRETRLLWSLLLLSIMYFVGLWDDVKDVSAYVRFVIEILVIWLAIAVLDVEINDFHGLWGIHELPDSISIPLSLFAGVGIINAVNMIDGVDGYCSYYGSWACIAFSIIFYRAGDMAMFTLSLISLGSLIPFFFHNVFGRKSKMFLGDGGSLMLGMLLTLFTFSTLSSNSPCEDFADEGLSLVALTLAILAVPVFDTLKVMVYRMIRGYSPFRADKTHLHHMFIEMEFTHLATSFIIVSTNILIGLMVLLAWCLGASINSQVYLVILVSLLFTCGFYFFMESLRRKRAPIFRKMCGYGRRTHMSLLPFWRFIAKVVDSRFLSGKTGTGDSQVGLSPDTDRPDPRILE